MNLHLENVNLSSTSGPNHFATKLLKYLRPLGVAIEHDKPPDARLCFIESHRGQFDEIPLFQRLDGIYFNKSQNYLMQNVNIQRTYNNAAGVIFQSHFNQQLITKYFGEHDNSVVIHNGADVEYIDTVKPIENKLLDTFENVWCCASSWRPHKRLAENIRYFLEHGGPKDCLIIAGKLNDPSLLPKHDRIFYVGNLNIAHLTALYKRAQYFIHLAWLDHCPNVVVDSRAAGCKVVCSSAGGTQEIAGADAVIIQEAPWDFEPVELYEPPPLNFSNQINNLYDVDYNMTRAARQYKKFLLAKEKS